MRLPCQKKSNLELNRMRIVIEPLTDSDLKSESQAGVHSAHVNRRLKSLKFYLIELETVIVDLD